MPAEVIELLPRFDPFSQAAERRYDGIVLRINGIRVHIRRLARQISELERQFVENDLTAGSGARRGQPLGPVGRRRRLKKLTALHEEMTTTCTEESRLIAHLDRMQTSLERWARDSFGAMDEARPEVSEP